ncbi:MAG: hypothetical protein GTO02_13120 [Candidatus Dadabacteria bacterium]|nr:hypothetical protein [Candidatus Dadabacteria bacterium]
MMLEFRKFMEAAPSGINKIAIFDFDDTLVFTPTPEEGKPAYQSATGEPWPHQGWWGQTKSMEPPVFNKEPEKLNQNVAKAFHTFRDDPHTYVVVMTGRIAKFENRVKEILNHYGIHPDEYFFRGQKDIAQHQDYPRKGDTFDYKAFVVINRLMSPQIQVVEIFDDREEHIPRFLQLGRDLKQNWSELKTVLIHDVRQNKNYTV